MRIFQHSSSIALSFYILSHRALSLDRHSQVSFTAKNFTKACTWLSIKYFVSVDIKNIPMYKTVMLSTREKLDVTRAVNKPWWAKVGHELPRFRFHVSQFSTTCIDKRTIDEWLKSGCRWVKSYHWYSRDTLLKSRPRIFSWPSSHFPHMCKAILTKLHLCDWPRTSVRATNVNLTGNTAKLLVTNVRVLFIHMTVNRLRMTKLHAWLP